MKLKLFFAAFLFSTFSFAQLPILLKDINPTGSSFGEYYIEFNGLTYFAADDGVHGQELWVSDGTNSGTQMLKDIRVGQFGSSIRGFIVFNNKLYFIANDNNNGEEIWVTDGTAANTQMLADYNPSSSNSNIRFIGIANNKLFFSIDLVSTGVELHCTDGTVSGTIPLGDIYPGNFDSNPSFPITYNGKLYFEANTNNTNRYLYQSDGTLAGTTQFDLYAGTGNAGNPLLGQGASKAVYNGLLYLSAGTAVTGEELWATDGTATGSSLVKDINPGTNGSGASQFMVLNQHLYFSANDGINGPELWKTDGTNAGTTLVKDINPGNLGSLIDNITVFNGKLFFVARTTASGFEPWISDGTSNGTEMLAEIAPGVSSSYPSSIVELGSKIYFIANNQPSSSSDAKLFESNGTVGNYTVLLPAGATNITGSIGFLSPAGGSTLNIYVTNGKLFFTGYYTNQLFETYTITPSAVGIEMLEKSNFSVFPNPVNENVTITGFDNEKSLQYSIVDISGKEISTGIVSIYNPTIDVKTLNIGLYFIHLQGISEGIRFVKM